jgi:hypothetical protein
MPFRLYSLLLQDRSPDDREERLAQGWVFYDLECRSCSNKGLLGVCTETRMGEEIWHTEGFFGIVDRKNDPHEEGREFPIRPAM